MLLEGTIKMACAQKKSLFTQFDLIGSKYGVCCTSSQDFEEFGAHSDEHEMSENWILRRFRNPKSISLRDYRLILCMLACLHKLQ